jgi:hypothetical protein
MLFNTGMVAQAVLKGTQDEAASHVRWFGPCGCVYCGDNGEGKVYVAGVLVGSYRSPGERNVLMVKLSEDKRVRMGELAEAFGVSSETLRLARKVYDLGGIAAVATVGVAGAPANVSKKVRMQAGKLFASGNTLAHAARTLKRKASYATVWRLHRQWKAEQGTEAQKALAAPATESQMPLPLNAANDTSTACEPVAWDPGHLSVVCPTPPQKILPTEAAADDTLPANAAPVQNAAVTQPAVMVPVDSASGEALPVRNALPCICAPPPQAVAAKGSQPSELAKQDASTLQEAVEKIHQAEINPVSAMVPLAVGATLLRADGDITIEQALLCGDHHVQHVGAWIALAMLNAMGVYSRAEQRGKTVVSLVALRIVLDAVVIALAIGQKCVEGVRRLQTRSEPTLLRTRDVVSASRTRQVLHEFANAAGYMFHAFIAMDLIRKGIDITGRVVLYVDNHTRRYTGKHILRLGWKMQLRRAVPGTTDYYVHDSLGRPLLRVDIPSHDSLARWLAPVARLCRRLVGIQPTTLMAFDRGGAFPSQMAELRNTNFEFVTYERGPYRRLPSTSFDQELSLVLDGKEVTLRWVEPSLKNLRAGRGRVRRICLLMPDNHQVNLLAISALPAEALINIQLHRWRQENGLKHGVERWGINQLDGRTVEATPPDTIIPNPARRRLDHRLRHARANEGAARRALARLKRNHRCYPRYKQQLRHALQTQARLLARRPTTPTRAPLRDTPLAGRLAQHDGKYKAVIDALRVALAHVEADLASRLAPLLPRPAEAKKALANLLAAPGHVHLSPGFIHVLLSPPGSAPESEAFQNLLRQLDRLQLSLPGDPEHRLLRFRVQ